LFILLCMASSMRQRGCRLDVRVSTRTRYAYTFTREDDGGRGRDVWSRGRPNAFFCSLVSDSPRIPSLVSVVELDRLSCSLNIDEIKVLQITVAFRFPFPPCQLIPSLSSRTHAHSRSLARSLSLARYASPQRFSPSRSLRLVISIPPVISFASSSLITSL